jgi:hypothetical protein
MPMNGVPLVIVTLVLFIVLAIFCWSIGIDINDYL